jgi:hypothetical protein
VPENRPKTGNAPLCFADALFVISTLEQMAGQVCMQQHSGMLSTRTCSKALAHELHAGSADNRSRHLQPSGPSMALPHLPHVMLRAPCMYEVCVHI